MHVILLPGLDGTSLLREDFRKALSLHHTVVTPSLPPELSDYAALADWVMGQLPAHPHVLIAESFSGPLAVLVATRRPPGLVGLILAASFVEPPRLAPAAVAALLRWLPLDAAWLARLAQPMLMGRWGSRSLRQQFRAALATVPRATLAARLRSVLTTDVSAAARALPLPKARITARHDRLVPSRASQALEPEISLTTDGPHLLLQCRAEAAAALVETILAQWAPGV